MFGLLHSYLQENNFGIGSKLREVMRDFELPELSDEEKRDL